MRNITLLAPRCWCCLCEPYFETTSLSEATACLISSHENLGDQVASSQITLTHLLIIADRYKQLPGRCPRRKGNRKKPAPPFCLSHLTILRKCGETSGPFLGDRGCYSVSLSGWYSAKSSSCPQVEHITQMCHNGGWAWMALKASVRPQRESGASSDDNVAFLQFLPCRRNAAGVLVDGKWSTLLSKGTSGFLFSPSKFWTGKRNDETKAAEWMGGSVPSGLLSCPCPPNPNWIKWLSWLFFSMGFKVNGILVLLGIFLFFLGVWNISPHGTYWVRKCNCLVLQPHIDFMN